MASQYGLPKVIAYTASKSAIEGMTRALAVELAPYGIRVVIGLDKRTFIFATVFQYHEVPH